MAQIGTKGASLDLLIRQGGTFLATVSATDATGLPINLTGGTITAQIRKTPSAVTIECSAVVVIINAVNGVFTFEFTAAATAALVASETSETDAASTYVWDIELLNSATKVIPLMYGTVNVWREVTR